MNSRTPLPRTARAALPHPFAHADQRALPHHFAHARQRALPHHFAHARRRALRLGLALCVLALSSAVALGRARADGTPGSRALDLEGAVERALATSDVLKAAGQSVEQAEANLTRAGLEQLPRVSAVGRYQRLSSTKANTLGTLVAAPNGGAGPLPDDTQLVGVPLRIALLNERYLVGGSATIPATDYLWRFPQTRRAAAEQARAARYGRADQRVGIAGDTRTAVFEWLRARLRTEVADQSVTSAQANLRVTMARVEAGSGTPADTRRVEAELARAELERVQEQRELELNEIRLRTLLHDPAGTRYEPTDGLLSELAPALEPASLHTLAETARAQRPDLLQQDASARALHAQAAAERAPALPRVDLIGNLQYENPSSRRFPQTDAFALTWDVGVQLSWALSEVPANVAKVRATRAQARAAESSARAQADLAELEVAQARSAIKLSQASIEAAGRRLNAAEESYRVRQALFQQGAATTIELLDAELERSRAQLAAIDARIDGRVARVELARALGAER